MYAEVVGRADGTEELLHALWVELGWGVTHPQWLPKGARFLSRLACNEGGQGVSHKTQGVLDPWGAGACGASAPCPLPPWRGLRTYPQDRSDDNASAGMPLQCCFQ